MNRLFFVVSIGLLLLVAPVKGEEWIYEWKAVELPPQHHAQWLIQGDGEYAVTDGALVLTTEGTQKVLITTTLERSHGLWDASAPLVIEFRAEAVERGGPGAAAGSLMVSDGERRYLISVEREGAHTYRLELDKGHASLSVEGLAAPELLKTVPLPADDAFPNALMFGDDSAGISGTSRWHFIRWSPL